MIEDFDDLLKEVNADLLTRCAAEENGLRRILGERMDSEREFRHIKIGNLARKSEVSLVQLRRLLHKELGGDLHLSTILRVADVLGLRVQLVLGYKL